MWCIGMCICACIGHIAYVISLMYVCMYVCMYVVFCACADCVCALVLSMMVGLRYWVNPLAIPV